MFDPLLLADFTAPMPILVGIIIIAVGILLLIFVIKTAVTLVKLAILVAIGVAAYLGISYLVG